MSEYDGLIKRLQNAAMWADKGLVIPPSLVLQAADAIDDLQGQLSVFLEGTKVRFVKNDDGTEEIRFENQWIPVTERLPEKDGTFITAYSKGGVSQNWYMTFHNGGGKWYQNSEDTGKVTHWMPLPSCPQPPEEET